MLIVLFAPYFEMLLERAGLIQNRSFPNIDHATQGVFLMHYLVTGKYTAEEPLLLLNRILCNIPLDQALPPSVEPEADWEGLRNGLLDAVINHWSSLGDTSHAGLISTFVQRTGSLRYDQEDGWSLHIDAGPYDMLLASLPWAISSINLPWMHQAIRVEWV